MLAEEWILQHITSTVIPEMSDLTDDCNLNQNIAGLIQEGKKKKVGEI